MFERPVWRTPSVESVLREPLLPAIGLLALIAGVAIAIFGGGSSGGTATTTIDAVNTLYVGPTAIAEYGPDFWLKVGDAKVKTLQHDGFPAAEVSAPGARKAFTVVQHSYRRPQDWLHRRWLFVPFKGQASGQPFILTVAFDKSNKTFAGFTFVDTSNGWTVAALDLASPDFGTKPFAFQHVRFIRVGAASKAGRVTFAIGRPTLSAK